MRSRAGRHSHRRRYNRKVDMFIIIGLMIVLTIAIVGFLMYVLTSPNWRWHS